MKLGIDIDGCLANFTTSYCLALIHLAGKDLFPKGWSTDPDFPKCWDFDLYYGYSPQMISRLWKNIMKSSTFWEELYHVQGVPVTVERLNKIAKKGEEVFFLTNRPGYLAKYQTEKWLKFYGMDFPTVIVGDNKPMVIKELGINVFIDDKQSTVDNVMDLMEKLDPSTLKTRVYLKDAPYNRDRNRAYRVVGSVKEMLEREGLWKG